MSEVSVNGITLYYEEYGSGTPLLLLHGLASSHLMYEKEIEWLKEHFRVIALDSRGHGRSDKPEEYTLEDHVQDVLSLMDHLDIEKAHILGTSMGSYIAQAVVIQAPNRVDKLILVVPKAHGKTSSTARLISEHEDELEGMDDTEKMDHLAQYIYHQTEVVQASMEELEEKDVTLTPEQEEAAAKVLEGFDFRPDLEKVTSDTLIISGKYDGLNPPEEGKEIEKRIPSSTFIEFEESGHLPSLEEPEKYRQEVLSFLGK